MRLTILLRERSNFQEKPHSRFTRSISADWLSDKQETRRTKETQFSWEKKYPIKGKMDSLRTSRNITSLDGSCYEVIDSSISQNSFSYLKMVSRQCRRNIRAEDNKKRMNIANFTNIHIYRYIYQYYMWKEWIKLKMIQ